MKKNHRRHFLRQAAALMAVPAMTLPVIGTRRARAAVGHKRRFLVVMNSLGIPPAVRSNLYATPVTSEERLGNLRMVLQPLEAYKENLLVLSGLHYQSARNQNFGGHPGGTGHALTGNDVTGDLSGNRTLLGNAGPSIDVAVANGLAAGTPFESLHLNVGHTNGNGAMGPSFRMNGTQIPRISGETAAFQTIFGADTSTDPSEDYSMRARLDAMAFASNRVRELRSELPGLTPQTALGAYQESVSSVARQIESIVTLVCDRPSQPNEYPVRSTTLNEAARTAQIDQMYELIRHTFACDMTRVVTLDIGGTSSRLAHPWLGINRDHHSISHESDDASLELMARIRGWYAERLNGFVRQLAETPEDGGTMLDNTVILWTTETSDARRHTMTDLPLVLIAGRNTGFRQGGSHFNFGGRPHNDLLTAILRSFELPSESFGKANLNRGPLEIFA